MNFRNDYSFGAHPEVLHALAKINGKPYVGYGEDEHCARAAQLIREKCKAPQAEVHFLVGGTQTNLTAIAAFLRPWESVITAGSGHINGHEAGAVEATGHKLNILPATRDGKLTPDALLSVLEESEANYTTRPKLVYISDTTELGGVYTKAELSALSEFCRAHGLYLFLDGARLAAALTSRVNDLTLEDLAALTDAFYIGGTKNGAMMGEALVICRKELQQDFFRVQKQRGAVIAKGWLLGVQFQTLFENDLYFAIACHANDMAERLQKGLQALGYPLLLESPSNQVFVLLSEGQTEPFVRETGCEIWGKNIDGQTVVRLTTSFATAAQEVDELLAFAEEQLK